MIYRFLKPQNFFKEFSQLIKEHLKKQNYKKLKHSFLPPPFCQPMLVAVCFALDIPVLDFIVVISSLSASLLQKVVICLFPLRPYSIAKCQYFCHIKTYCKI